MIFEIPLKFPTLNEHIAALSKNRYKGGNLKKKTESDILWYLKNVKEKISCPVIVNFTWHEKSKRRDKDNVAFAKKYILDALQKSGILPNDNNQYIAGFTDNFVYGKVDKVVVEINAAI